MAERKYLYLDYQNVINKQPWNRLVRPLYEEFFFVWGSLAITKKSGWADLY